MSASPHTNGGILLRELALPDYREYAVEVPKPATTSAEATRVLGGFLRDVVREEPTNFRLFGPDETASNRLDDVFEVTGRAWDAETAATDEDLSPDGRVMEILSEHLCQGWLEGYLLTGRHGLFNCYEAFIHIVDSMFNQHAKWLKVTPGIPWRRPIASLNYLLSSHVWRQDHNGFSHQEPGFIDHVANKKAEVIRVYLPPDANTLLSVADHCLRSRHYVNVIVAGKQPALNYLSIDEAIVHCTRGLGIWEWASSDDGSEPDVVLACCGDIPTLETLAAASILREGLPELKVRVVNVVDLMRLQPASEHPHGLSDHEFDAIFTNDRPVVFAYHGYPWLIHRLTYRRTNHLQPARPRVQGGGYDDDAVRHGDAERPRPLPPRQGRDRPGTGARHAGRTPAPGDGRPENQGARLDPGAWRGPPRRSATGPGRTEPDPRRQRGLDEPQALGRQGDSSASVAALENPPDGIVAVGHRVVHGGQRYRDPTLIDDEVVAAIRELVATGTAPQRSRIAGDRGRPAGSPGRPARRSLRHRLPRHDARTGDDVCGPAALARGVGRTSLRVPRPRGRLRRERVRPAASSSVISAVAAL